MKVEWTKGNKPSKTDSYWVVLKRPNENASRSQAFYHKTQNTWQEWDSEGTFPNSQVLYYALLEYPDLPEFLVPNCPHCDIAPIVEDVSAEGRMLQWKWRMVCPQCGLSAVVSSTKEGASQHWEELCQAILTAKGDKK